MRCDATAEETCDVGPWCHERANPGIRGLSDCRSLHERRFFDPWARGAPDRSITTMLLDFVDEIVQLSLDDAHQQVDQACRLPSGRVTIAGAPGQSPPQRSSRPASIARATFPSRR